MRQAGRLAGRQPRVAGWRAHCRCRDGGSGANRFASCPPCRASPPPPTPTVQPQRTFSEDTEHLGLGGEKERKRSLAGKLLGRTKSKLGGGGGGDAGGGSQGGRDGGSSTGSLDRLAFGSHQLGRDRRWVEQGFGSCCRPVEGSRRAARGQWCHAAGGSRS